MADTLPYGKDIKKNISILIFRTLDPDEHLFSPSPDAAYKVLSKLFLL